MYRLQRQIVIDTLVSNSWYDFHYLKNISLCVTDVFSRMIDPYNTTNVIQLSPPLILETENDHNSDSLLNATFRSCNMTNSQSDSIAIINTSKFIGNGKINLA